MIINADDYGKDEMTTNAIIEAFRRGCITQTTLMVNMPFADRAVALAREKGFAEHVGLHLNLTEGRPLTPAMAECSTFCDRSGVFKGKFPPQLDMVSVAAMKAEIQAQIERFRSFKLPLLHCDGHHHAQNRRAIACILMSLLKEFGFRTIRRPCNVYPGRWRPHLRSRLGQIRFALQARRNSLVASSDVFGGWTPAIERIVRRGMQTVEIMVHPGFDLSGTLVDVVDFRNGSGIPLDGIIPLRNEGRSK